MRYAILFLGTQSAQMYMTAVFAAAIIGNHPHAMLTVIAAEGATTVSYQAQLLARENSRGWDRAVVLTTAVSWALAATAGVLLI